MDKRICQSGKSHESSREFLLSSRCRSLCRWFSVTATGKGSSRGFFALGLLTELRVRPGSLSITTAHLYYICLGCMRRTPDTTCAWDDIACTPDSSINTQSGWGSLGAIVSLTRPRLLPLLDVWYPFTAALNPSSAITNSSGAVVHLPRQNRLAYPLVICTSVAVQAVTAAANV